MVRIDSLVKEYDGKRAVDGLCLQVDEGVILGLVGPNGAGKTTTLRCLCGIIPPTSGSIQVCGHDIQGEAVEARRQLAFVPDEPHLFDHLTCRDHLRLFARLYGVPDGFERGRELLEQNNLGQQLDAFPNELSRGMKQKLILCCALLHRPRVLVLDEPLTGLDPRAMRQTRQTILETARQGAAVMVSSHMLQLVEEICGRILIVNHGRKVVEGTLEEIRSSVPELDADADLETIFLRATDEGGGA